MPQPNACAADNAADLTVGKWQVCGHHHNAGAFVRKRFVHFLLDVLEGMANLLQRVLQLTQDTENMLPGLIRQGTGVPDPVRNRHVLRQIVKKDIRKLKHPVNAGLQIRTDGNV